MAEQLTGHLTSLAGSLKSTLFTAADVLDRQADIAAALLRETINNSSSWVKPPPPPPPPLPVVLKRGVVGWVKENKWAVAIVAATGVGIGAWVYGKRRQRRSGRRAKKAPDGGRKEVVVLAGSPHDPVARSLALDLERRGFIVFVVVSTVEDEQVVINEGRGDVRPLNIDIADPTSSQSTLDKFTTYLSTPVPSFPGAHPHRLTLTGLILLPTGPPPTGPLETIPTQHWSDTINLKLLSPLLTTKLLLRPLIDASARILICTPNLIAPLSPPFHAPECASVAAIHAVARSLRRELEPSGVSVTVLKMGTFDVGPGGAAGGKGLQLARADVIGWGAGARAAYARGYVAMQAGRAAAVKGSPLKELHGAVVEALVGRRRREVCVGVGSTVYEVLGKWAPECVVGWLVGGVGEVLGGNGGSGGGSEGEWEKV